jgi:hypothetical protein
MRRPALDSALAGARPHTFAVRTATTCFVACVALILHGPDITVSG